MKITLSIESKYIAAVMVAAAKNDIRYYLNSLCLEIGQYETKLVATDGHRLLVASVLAAQDDLTELTTVILPRAMLDRIKLKGNTLIQIDYNQGKLEHEVKVTYDGKTEVGRTIDGKYPDWRRIVPESVSGEVAQFNRSCMADFAKVAAFLKEKTKLPYANVRITPNGPGAAWVAFEKEPVFGLIMPQRIDAKVELPTGLPEWVKTYPHAATKAA